MTAEPPKKHSISFRLNDEHNEKLENLANSGNIQKSTMASNLIIDMLNENVEELLINHISYPRPVIKKLFSLLTESQMTEILSDFNQYNTGIIKCAMQKYPNEKIFNLLNRWFRRSGCEVNCSSFNNKKYLEIHHELEKNWSIVTCASTSYILEVLGNEVTRTFVETDWFRIEYVKK